MTIWHVRTSSRSNWTTPRNRAAMNVTPERRCRRAGRWHTRQSTAQRTCQSCRRWRWRCSTSRLDRSLRRRWCRTVQTPTRASLRQYHAPAPTDRSRSPAAQRRRSNDENDKQKKKALAESKPFDFTSFSPVFQKIATVIQGFDARLANRPFLVFDFRVLWRSGLSARVPESQKLKMVISQPGIEYLSHCPHFGTMVKNGLTWSSEPGFFAALRSSWWCTAIWKRYAPYSLATLDFWFSFQMSRLSTAPIDYCSSQRLPLSKVSWKFVKLSC